MKQATEQKQSEARAYQRDANLVDASAALGAGGCCSSGKNSSPASGYVSGSAGVAVGQIAGAKTEVFVVVDALDIDGVNGSATVTTGSGSGPRHDLGLTAVNRQTVASLDLVDLGPADGCCDERIHNGDSLVVDQDMGFDEQQPAQNCCGGNDTGLQQPGAVAVESHLNNEQNVDIQSQDLKDECCSGSEFNRIGHSTILPPLDATPSFQRKQRS